MTHFNPPLAQTTAKLAAFLLALLPATLATTQNNFPAFGVALKKHIPLSAFNASSAAGSWGYTSPSGREYAIIGLNNSAAFVEVTNPANPTIIAQIPHTSILWCEIKVYKDVCYVVTEANGTGIQVIDMAQIDQGVVTLLRTIPSPGRSHNVVVDEVAGYLYTTGSRNGTGTTMCFDITDPRNPVQVGKPSMTPDYQHDALCVTYTHGPLAGRTIWYGFSEGRGVDIYDFTDKNNPTLIKRVPYPDIGYTHQGWLSDCKRYLYVNDELDENILGINSRTIVIDVSNPATASFVTTFSTGLPSIDHNNYVRDGFLFQANYRTGLQIFDLADSLTNPARVGWFDTYPANDNRGFNGAWNNYPFFPSGTVIVSDIEGGLFVLDPDQATTRRRPNLSFQTNPGAVLRGTLADLADSDDKRLEISETPDPLRSRVAVGLLMRAKSYDNKPDKIRLEYETRANQANFIVGVQLFDFTQNAFVTFRTDPTTTADQALTLQLPNPQIPQARTSADLAKFVHPESHEIRARLFWAQNPGLVSRLTVAVDRVAFHITR